MFARRMYPGRYFAPTYFPPVEQVTPPIPEPPVHHGGTRARWRKTEDVMREWRIRQDDEEFFLIE